MMLVLQARDADDERSLTTSKPKISQAGVGRKRRVGVGSFIPIIFALGLPAVNYGSWLLVVSWQSSVSDIFNSGGVQFHLLQGVGRGNWKKGRWAKEKYTHSTRRTPNWDHFPPPSVERLKRSRPGEIMLTGRSRTRRWQCK
jgi:hypothetical protein